jgi:L-lactate dehydrogenase complex protein LldG
MTTPRTTRAAFLERVRAAVAKQPRSAPANAPKPDESLARLVSHSDELRTIFLARARAAGITVLDEPALAAALAHELRKRSVQRVTLAIADDSLRQSVTRMLASSEIQILAGEGPLHHFAADAGITDVEAAIAETGSIVVASGANSPRAAAMVPPIHFALVRWSQLVPDLLDLPPLSTAAASRTIISGPSKTADIEGILITGVHGPREVLILMTP